MTDSPQTTTTAAPTSTTTAPTSAVPQQPVFMGEIALINAELQARMDGRSMRPGCPVGYDQLRHLTLSHWDFEGAVRTGELVVHETVAEDIVAVFRQLFELRYPIRRMTLVDDFGPGSTASDGADDFASIEADNTSAFNCRTRTGSGSEYSQHAFGTAIDLNPLENPYVGRSGTTSHPASVPFLDRSAGAPGVVTADDPVVRALRSIGWGWGGDWEGIKDYQHFSATGR